MKIAWNLLHWPGKTCEKKRLEDIVEDTVYAGRGTQAGEEEFSQVCLSHSSLTAAASRSDSHKSISMLEPRDAGRRAERWVFRRNALATAAAPHRTHSRTNAWTPNRTDGRTLGRSYIRTRALILRRRSLVRTHGTHDTSRTRRHARHARH